MSGEYDHRAQGTARRRAKSRTRTRQRQSRNATILVVEDDPTVRGVIRTIFQADGYEVVETASCAAVQRGLKAVRPDAAILDYQLPDGNALDLLPHLREVDPYLPILILTAHDDVELAVEAMQHGADHFLTKPAKPETLRKIVARCVADRKVHRRKLGYEVNRERNRPDPFRGTSKQIAQFEQRALKVAAANRPVLLMGETGCGKGVLAQWLHDHSPRAEEPFVNLNCAGLKTEFLESELFGHAKGAFTGAVATKPGLLEAADRGTLFLDEIGDMDLAIQAKLLKVLEEQTFRRLGEVQERWVDVRLIAATHRDFTQLTEDGHFRSDLYFRLSTLRLEIPSLHQRRQDIPSLAVHFLERLGREVGRPDLALSSDAIEALVGYRWPGNIRELRNVLERAVLLGEREILQSEDFYFETAVSNTAEEASSIDPQFLNFSLEEVEKLHIERILAHVGGSISQAARKLGIQRNTLYQKIKKYEIKRPDR